MKPNLRPVAPLLAAALLLSFVDCRAQPGPNDQHGTVYAEKNNQRLPEMDKIRAVVIQDPVLRPPVGFDAVYHVFDMDAPKEIPWQRLRPTVIDFGMPEYYADKTGAFKLSSEAMADIDFEVNSFRRLYDDTYSHDLDAAGYPCPIFFFRYHKKTADSTHEYVEYRGLDGSKPIRIVTNGKPLFVPLNREQYLNFQIQYNKKNADVAQRSYVHDSVTIANVPGKQDVLKGDRDLVNTWRQRMDRHRQQLAGLTAEEKVQPAIIVWGGGTSSEEMEDLTTADDSRAQELWTINPGYFNKSLPPGAIQMIVVYPEYASIATPYIKGKLMDVFQQIDYKALRALIQN